MQDARGCDSHELCEQHAPEQRDCRLVLAPVPGDRPDRQRRRVALRLARRAAGADRRVRRRRQAHGDGRPGACGPRHLEPTWLRNSRWVKKDAD